MEFFMKTKKLTVNPSLSTDTPQQSKSDIDKDRVFSHVVIQIWEISEKVWYILHSVSKPTQDAEKCIHILHILIL